jgi:thiamine pyrophosphate-dependent acetolactate synthase large subunit-like protein
MHSNNQALDFELRRREVAKKVLEAGGDEFLLISGLGSSNWDFTAAGDRDTFFPLWGAMGGAVPIGLGLAIAQPTRRVVVATGDGEMLMGVGSLATVAMQMPKNLAILVFDNERYGETGMQETATALRANLEKIAQGCGIVTTKTIRKKSELLSVLPHIFDEDGPLFFVIKVRAEPLDFVLPPKDGAFLKDRFRSAVLRG